MALTTIPSELSSVSGIADSSDATAITIDSSENVILSSNLTMPGGSNVTWGTSYPALGNIPNSQATILGNNIKAGATNNTVVRHANGTDAANFIALTYNKGVTFHTGIATTQNSEVAETTNERMRIDATGKVGIGETSPTRFFVVKRSDSAGTVAEFENTGTSTYIQFTCNSQADNAAGYVGYNSDKDLTLWTNDVQRVTIDVNGYMGIGEQSPDNALHVTGGAWNNAHIKIERTDVGGSNDAGLVFKSAAGAATDTALGGIWFQNALDSNAYALIRARTDDSSGTSGRLEFMTSTSAVGNATTPRLVIDSGGQVLPGGDATQNLGSASKRWDNLYVGDMHFSNEGSEGNEVDGTTGNWTLQEGEEHLYIINNKSGKKFKFSLEEVQ